MASTPGPIEFKRRSIANKSGSPVTTEPFQHLIQHIKQHDPMLYEALNRAQSQINNVGQTINKTVNDTVDNKLTVLNAVYKITLDLYDLTVGNSICIRSVIHTGGKLLSIAYTLSAAITSDLTVRININTTVLFTLTIPKTTVVGRGLAVSTPKTQLNPLDVLSYDITASDGTVNNNGIASLFIIWQ